MEQVEQKECDTRIVNIFIKNFGCFGEHGVSVDINKIVIIVGENNIGKSTILNAFNAVTSEAKLKIDDFYLKNEKNLPEIIVTTYVNSKDKPGENWCREIEKDKLWEVKEKWTWKASDTAPVRVGLKKIYIEDSTKKLCEAWMWADRIQDVGKNELVPWGTTNVAKARRPKPHRIGTFDSPEQRSKIILDILNEGISGLIKKYISTDNNSEEAVQFRDAIVEINNLKETVRRTQETTIGTLQTEINSIISQVFPSYNMYIKGNDDYISRLFTNEFQIEFGDDVNTYSLLRQGSGTQRTAIWAVLKILTDKGLNVKKQGKVEEKNSSHILLIDEPELSLHPSASSRVRDILYDLAESSNWQVMLTTHSPDFIDLSKDNTTIIRVEKDQNNQIYTSTLFAPDNVKLNDNDKVELKLLNIFDSHIGNAFFGGDVLVVEGDTEYGFFKYIKSNEFSLGNAEFHDLNIIRARGKSTIASVMKVLNHFKRKYYVLHDTDTPTCQVKRKKGVNKETGLVEYEIKTQKNPAWSSNENIYNQISDYSNICSSIHTFEKAYFDEIISSDKPYHSLSKIKSDVEFYDKMKNVLKFILGRTEENLDGIIRCSSLEQMVSLYTLKSNPDSANSSEFSQEKPA